MSALSSGFNADAVAGIAVSADDLNSDIHASSEYRAHLVTVMAASGCESRLITRQVLLDLGNGPALLRRAFFSFLDYKKLSQNMFT